MQEYTELVKTFKALEASLTHHPNLNGCVRELLGELDISFSKYDHALNIAKKQELEKEVSRLEKVVSDGFAEYYKLFKQNNQLKQDLEALKKVTFED